MSGESIYPWGENSWGDGEWDVQLSITTTSYVSAIHSSAVSQGTSLSLVDFSLTYDEDKFVWYTNWFREEKVLSSHNDIALQIQTAPQIDDPAATIYVEYDNDGDGEVTSRSDPIYVDGNEMVQKVTSVSTDEDGYYRLRIGDYGGYNDITNINIGFVN